VIPEKKGSRKPDPGCDGTGGKELLKGAELKRRKDKVFQQTESTMKVSG